MEKLEIHLKVINQKIKTFLHLIFEQISFTWSENQFETNQILCVILKILGLRTDTIIIQANFHVNNIINNLNFYVKKLGPKLTKIRRSNEG